MKPAFGARLPRACALLTLVAMAALVQSPAGESMPVLMGKDGRLIYQRLPGPTDQAGDTLPDYSVCGYGGGGLRLPMVPVVTTITPRAGDDDDTKRIQDAVDALARLPADKNGIRGALLLKRGRYRIAGTVNVVTGGIVIRGEGQDEEKGTVLYAPGTDPRVLLNFVGEGRLRPDGKRATRITDTYVPLGVKSFLVASATGLRPGDRVIVRRIATVEWNRNLGMGMFAEWTKSELFDPARFTAGASTHHQVWERRIVGVQGNHVTIDSPVLTAIDQRWGGGDVTPVADSRPAQGGVEDLMGISEATGDMDEKHAVTLIDFTHFTDCWVQRVTSRRFQTCVSANYYSRDITVQDSSCLDPAAPIEGGRRYAFVGRGQGLFVQRCFASKARHSFVMTGIASPGPNVFLDCVAEDSLVLSETHNSVESGVCFDNVRDSHGLGLHWQGNSRGVSGINSVLWNCIGGSINVHRFPSINNWAIGCQGEINGRYQPAKPEYLGTFISHGKPVAIRSLYLAQLRDRLGDQAVLNVVTAPQPEAGRRPKR